MRRSTISGRGFVWVAGLTGNLGLFGFLVENSETPGLAIPGAILGVGLVALIAEMVGLQTARTSSTPPRHARAADGVVEVEPVRGVEAVVIETDPRWRRFVRLLDEVPAEGLLRSNPTLLGRVVWFSIFVGRDGRTWTDREIAQAHISLERAGRWVEGEAIRYQAPVNLGLADTFFQVQDNDEDLVEVEFSGEGDDVGPMEAHALTKALEAASRASKLLGFAEMTDLVRRINPRVEADVRVWLIHLKQSGRSMAIPVSESWLPGVGLAISYSRESSFPEPLMGEGRVDSTTIVHEVFHLFGATDKYGVSLESFPDREVTSRDLMRLDHSSLSRMRIDPLTAREVGWPSSEPKKNRSGLV